MNKRLLGKLVCPLCRSKLRMNENIIICNKCGQKYGLINKIPNFLPENLMQKYNTELKLQDLEEEKKFYDRMYQNLNGLDDGHCVVYGYDEIYGFMDDIPKGSLLDIGCGAGHHSKDLALIGYEVTGIDISLNGLQQAEKVNEARKLDVSFVLGDVENLPFDDNSFDIVFCSLIIHHFVNRHKLLSEVARVCKKYFLAFEVNAYDPLSFLRFDIINPTIGIHNITKNQRTVSPVKLEKELRCLGFNDILVRYADIHHNIGRYPRSFLVRMLNIYKKTTNILPYKCRFNKFIMKCKK